MRKNSDSVIVIGAGLSGLSAASYLSRQGVRVKLIERLNQLGGFVHTFKRGKYTFEASTHQITGLQIPGYGQDIIKKLGLNNIQLVKSPVLCEVISFNPGSYEMDSRYKIPSGYENFRNSLIAYFPENKNDIDNYITLISKIGKAALKLKNITRNPDSVTIDAILALFLSKGNGFIKKIGNWRYSPVTNHANSRFIDAIGHIGNKDLQWLLGVYNCYLGSDPQTLNAFMMCMLNYMYLQDGPYLLKGGTGTLIQNMVESITLNGGTILKNQSVKQIQISNGKAVGVITDDGQSHTADAVISAINTYDTFCTMIPSNELPAEYLKSIQCVENSNSVFQIYLGLKCNPKEFGFTAPTTFFDSIKNMSERYAHLVKSTTPESRSQTSFLFSNYADSDLGLSPAGTASVSIVEGMIMDDWSTLSPQEYKKKKELTTEIILNKVEKLTGIPIKELAEVVVSASPRTLYHYSCAPEGAFVGAAYSSAQILQKRTQPQTPIKNLFLSGAFCGYGGVLGSLDSGIVASNQVLKTM